MREAQSRCSAEEFLEWRAWLAGAAKPETDWIAKEKQVTAQMNLHGGGILKGA